MWPFFTITLMNTNTMELNMNEMETVIGGGDTLDHVAGALTGVAVGMMVGAGVGSIAGAPGVAVGVVAGGTGCGIAGGIFGFTRIRDWAREHLPRPNRC